MNSINYAVSPTALHAPHDGNRPHGMAASNQFTHDRVRAMSRTGRNQGHFMRNALDVNPYEWASNEDIFACRTAFEGEQAKLGIVSRDINIVSAPVTELLDLRNDARRVVNSVLDRTRAEKRELSARENAAMKGAGEWIADLEKRLRFRAYVDERGLDRPALAHGGEQWRDGDGNVIPVLEKHQRLSALTTGGRHPGFNFGQFVRAAVAGTNVPEIRNALSEGTDSAGGYTVPTRLLGEFIDRLRAATVSIQAGARTVPLDTKTSSIARIASDPVAAWRNEAAAIAESDPTFEQVLFTPRSLAVLVKVSRELLDDSLNLDEALQSAFAGSLAGELDRVALMGSGSAPEPRGIFNQSGIGSVSMGTNGAQFTTWAKLLDTIYEITLDNAGPASAAVMHPRTARAIDGLADTTGQPLRRPNSIEQLPFLQTSQIPIIQVQGSASNASSIIAGDFRQLMIGIRQDLRIEILRERYAENHQYAFVAHLRADIAVAHPESFSKLIGIIP